MNHMISGEDLLDGLSLEVSVVDPSNVIFQGHARSLSSFNDKGPFDILPLHSNFITLISTGLNIVDTQGTSHSVALKAGVLVCKNNQVKVFLGF